MEKIVFASGCRTDFNTRLEKELLTELENYRVEKVWMGEPLEERLEEQKDRIGQALAKRGTVLVGYSIGATISLSMRKREAVKAVVAIDPPRGVNDRTGKVLTLDRIEDRNTLIIGSQKARDGLPDTRGEKEIFDTGHSFSGARKEVARRTREFIESCRG